MQIQKTKKNRNRWNGRRRGSRSKQNKQGKMSPALDPGSLIKSNRSKEENSFTPSLAFNSLDLHQKLKSNLEEKGFTYASEIQEASLEALLEGRNLVGVASTGTGKTAAFLIPLVERLLRQPSSFKTLIVVPTRELAQQVEQEFKSIARHTGLYSSCMIGGTSVGQDMAKLKRINHFLIGTPGRLLDLYQRGALTLEDIEVLILDEFDRMLDMGFVHDIKKLVGGMHKRKQTLLFSATIDPSQKDLVAEIVPDPINIRVNSGNNASSHVDQHLIYVQDGQDKFQLLVDMVSSEDFEKVIVFAETKRMVDKLSKKLGRSGVAASYIHGDKTQNFRNRAIKDFRQGVSKVLVATDVAARGIDIDKVSHVINYQMPLTKDSYVHRIGRTGRAGNKGTAYTFVG